MTHGLKDAGALARVCYHAQELSLLATTNWFDPQEVKEVKRALDGAFDELFNPVKERREPH